MESRVVTKQFTLYIYIICVGVGVSGRVGFPIHYDLFIQALDQS